MANRELPSAESYPKGPVPLLQVKASRWHVNKEAICILRKINMDIVPVAIVGKYRTGKSCLMNRIAGAKSGFEVGSSIQSMTKGIWMWPTMHPWDKWRCLLLLDTEGLYDVEKGDPDNDLQMFTLALLMSTCIIFNIMYNLDDQFVKELQLVAEITDRIKFHGQNGCTSVESIALPALVVVVRDFNLALEKDGKTINSDEYLELAIASKPTKGENYNKPRESIKRLFPQRNCFVLPRPVSDDKLLSQLDGKGDIQFTPEFLIESGKASDKILELASSFTYGYRRLGTTNEYIDILQEYVKCINDGGIPSIGSAFASLRERELIKVTRDLINTYHERKMKLQSYFPVSPKDLQMLRCGIQKLAQVTLTEMRLPQKIFDRSLKSLETMLNKVHSKTLEENEEVLMKICKESFECCFSNILGPCSTYIRRGGYEEYLLAKGNSIDAYFSKVEHHGMPAKSKLTQFLERLVDKENGLRCSCEKIEDIEREKQKDANRLLEKQQQLQEALSKFEKEVEIQSKACAKEYDIMQKGYENMLQAQEKAHEREREVYKELLSCVRNIQEQIQEDLTNTMKATIEVIKTDIDELQCTIDKYDSKLELLKELKDKDPLSAEYATLLAEAND